MSDYRCTECGNRHNDGADCPQVLYDIAASFQRGKAEGYVKALDDLINIFPDNQDMRMVLLGTKVDFIKNGRKHMEPDGENIAEYYDNYLADKEDKLKSENGGNDGKVE